MPSFLFKFVKFTMTSSFHFSSRPSEVFFLFCSRYDKYFKWDIIAFNAHKIPLFSTTDELTEMEILELSLLRSPLLRWSGFWTYFGIITCSCWLLRRNAQKMWNISLWPLLWCQCLMFFPLKWLWAPIFPCLKCQMHHALCFSPLTSHSHSFTVISEATNCWKHTCPLF